MFLSIAAMGVAGCSSHWPAFRHDGLRTGGQLRGGPLSNAAKAAKLDIVWSFPASAGVAMNPPLIAFRASPVIYKKTVYIGNGNGFLYAINAEDGKLRWRYPKNGPPLDQTFHSNPSSNGIASSATIVGACCGGSFGLISRTDDVRTAHYGFHGRFVLGLGARSA